MSRAVNKAILLGRLGADPEIRYTSSGTAVVNVSLATNESWTDKEGNRQEKTEWHRLVFWRQLAEIAGQYLRKGGQIYVEGTLRYRTYEDSEGRERFTTEVEVRELSMLDGPRGEELDTSFDPEELEAIPA
ncbi:MAG: single-stranded DNA-binding protein [Gemmatimonadetes bacterium]|nr:single-stranded DNA-binding protein [Gemmatimonadota bacterium]